MVFDVVEGFSLLASKMRITLESQDKLINMQPFKLRALKSQLYLDCQLNGRPNEFRQIDVYGSGLRRVRSTGASNAFTPRQCLPLASMGLILHITNGCTTSSYLLHEILPPLPRHDSWSS
ncbi:hypothetical protein PI124_g12587 [Phytophthora idaei]|nr:hypothetical protein PI124_g12587 [Phytophthora idaei]